MEEPGMVTKLLCSLTGREFLTTTLSIESFYAISEPAEIANQI
jgi:hypothetical protein